ncbi:MAG TPA: hybrid sensor histidine kinase/response regulator [Rhodospirillaceae bacterium]|nr:MAG: ATPase [Alphaproteobacteria bacterium GWF2_58_20]HAU28950.1 hybrid sensor histidine kinase/response regulator [Rhodospirillaceae bacterium]
MDDLLREFLTETTENLSVLDLELVRLEQNPNDHELLSNIFRLVHTIKGTCGFLGLPRLESVAHAGENILGKFRDGELTVTPKAVTLILEAIDTIKMILLTIEQTEHEPPGNDENLIGRLNALADSCTPTAATSPVSEPVAPASATTSPETVEPPPPVQAPPPTPPIEETLETPQPQPPAPKPQEKPAAAPAGNASPVHASDSPHESAVAANTLRVNVDLLESLMTRVSELVLTRNQLLQILRSQKENAFTAPLQRLSQVVSELQEDVMKTRMQPIGNAWAKLPRIIRDLSHELGKKIELELRGAETELDRQVLEMIKDPLTHMVRNSADHGIELPADRLASGKPETGTIRLNAYHEGGHINIEISDDGKGLPLEKIKHKIISAGLASEAELSALPEQQIYQYIFKPGFSTAEKISAVSGRGVGMDVVKTNIEKIGGTVEMKSQEGKGATFRIKIPLTLAIVSALIVSVGPERFAIPQISVIELVRASADGEHRIERLKGTPVLRLRNHLLPLVSLRDLLHIEDGNIPSDNEAFIIVTQVGSYSFGIIVDRVFDTEEIVVKPVAPILRHIEMFSGNTILGDGSVIMILDPNGIASSTGEITVSDDQAKSARTSKNQHSDDSGKTSLLIFRAGQHAPKAVPLSLVARIEDIDMALVEYAEGQPVIQYRDCLMPLIPFDAGTSLQEISGRKPVLVFADDAQSMGLVVDEIVDIVEERIQIQITEETPGMMGSSIIAGKSTDIIDVGHYLSQSHHDWFGAQTSTGYGSDPAELRKRLLLVDDSAFFRNMLAPLLGVAGYEVTSVENAGRALAMRDDGRAFDIIVSDIEMPGMDGFALAQNIKADPRWQATPLIALTSHAAPDDLERGRQVGFSDYVVKFDREAILNALSQTMNEKRDVS